MLEALVAIMVTRSFSSESLKCQIVLLNGLWAFQVTMGINVEFILTNLSVNTLSMLLSFYILFVNNVLYKLLSPLQ
jgi:hypothetical protein